MNNNNNTTITVNKPNSNLLNVVEESFNHNKQIEKSYSNLSKDSGVLIESYHSSSASSSSSSSSSSTNTPTPPSSSSTTLNRHNNINNNVLNSHPISTQNNSSYDEDEAEEEDGEYVDDEIQNRTEEFEPELDNQKEEIEEEDDEEEENEPVKDLGYQNFLSLKQNFLNTNLNNSAKKSKTNGLKLQLLNNKISQKFSNINNSNHLTYNKKHINIKNLTLNTNNNSSSYNDSGILEDVDKRMMSILPDASSSPSSPYFSKQLDMNMMIPSSNSSTPSPIVPQTPTNLTKTPTTNNNNNMFMSSYTNSLMNVSMLDNIQIDTTNQFIDSSGNMNSSILMFN
jgi:hypothetical protein